MKEVRSNIELGDVVQRMDGLTKECGIVVQELHRRSINPPTNKRQLLKILWINNTNTYHTNKLFTSWELANKVEKLE